jgi:hypothetical protein
MSLRFLGIILRVIRLVVQVTVKIARRKTPETFFLITSKNSASVHCYYHHHRRRKRRPMTHHGALPCPEEERDGGALICAVMGGPYRLP